MPEVTITAPVAASSIDRLTLEVTAGRGESSGVLVSGVNGIYFICMAEE